MQPIQSSEITPEHVFLNRRKFMAAAGTLAAGAALAACSMPEDALQQAQDAAVAVEEVVGELPAPLAHEEPFASAATDTLGRELNSFEAITNYNNFYEFSTDKESVARLAEDFVTAPWEIEVGGLVNNPGVFDLDDLYGFEQEERIYRLRCVEAWSMVIPWVGFPISALLAQVEPTAEAQFVRFETVVRPEQMEGQKRNTLDWPYVEGLRLDEAMHPLAILATGVYGKPLVPANGAPIRLVVPWKYGFKSIKSIVKIDLVAEQPLNTWQAANSREYGFYANVNPEVDHPRWSQGTERVIGGGRERIETLPFNGYAEEVASLYDGMDLRANF